MPKGPQNRNRRFQLYGIFEVLIGIGLTIADVIEHNWYWIVVSVLILGAGTYFLIFAAKASRRERADA
jgi:hypothetical protein